MGRVVYSSNRPNLFASEVPRKPAVLRVVCGIGKHELHSSSVDELKIGVLDAAPILGEDLDSRRNRVIAYIDQTAVEKVPIRYIEGWRKQNGPLILVLGMHQGQRAYSSHESEDTERDQKT